MPGKYIPPHKRAAVAPSPSSPRSSAPRISRTQITRPVNVFFGDSFIRLFGLVKHSSVRIHPFKGASAKGLGRDGNENRQAIARAIRHTPNVERCIFCFGSVDVHLSYYYKKYVRQEGEIDLNEIARQYVRFVASLPITKAERIIVGIYPSPLEDDSVGASLVKYRSLMDEQMEMVAASEDAKLENRQGRVLSFNRALATHCVAYGVEYIDVVEEMLDTATLKIREEYRDIADQNIHIVWETTLLVWLEKWPWLKELIPPTFHAQLNKTLNTYLATKPWATRTHVSQTM